MNKNVLSNMFMFVTGAVIGSVVTWKLVKTKYEQIAQEEIESVREVYGMSSKKEEIVEEETEEDTVEDYKSIVDELGYTENIEKEEDDVMEPYVIAPEEYDENGYDTVSLYYYEDGVLENAITREVVENASVLVGDDFADHFGEYEEDSVFIRNDRLKTDFEILRDGGYYSEVE